MEATLQGLPAELLMQLVCNLDLEDRMRLSATCRRLRAVMRAAWPDVTAPPSGELTISIRAATCEADAQRWLSFVRGFPGGTHLQATRLELRVWQELKPGAAVDGISVFYLTHYTLLSPLLDGYPALRDLLDRLARICGRVQELRLGTCLSLRDWPLWPSMPSLRHLTLDVPLHGSMEVPLLTDLPDAVETLTLQWHDAYSCDGRSSRLHDVTGLPSGLRHLRLACHDFCVSRPEELYISLHALTGLRELTLIGRADVLHPGMARLALTSLCAHGMLGPREHLRHLPTTLRRLELSDQKWHLPGDFVNGNDVEGEEDDFVEADERVLGAMGHIGALTGLTRLALDGDCGFPFVHPFIHDQGGDELAALSSLTQLRELSLVYAETGPQSLRSLLDLTSLTSLSLSMNPKTSHDVRQELSLPEAAPDALFAPVLRRLAELHVCFVSRRANPVLFLLPDTVRFTMSRLFLK